MSTKKDRMRPKGKPRKVQIPAQVEQWLRRAFIIDHDGLIPKTAMYENYEAFCRSIKIRPRPPNTFGKLLVVVHPHIRTRRMGPHSCQVAYYAGISPQVHDSNDNDEMSNDNISLNSSTNSNDYSTDSETPSSSPPSSPFLSSSIPTSPRSASFSLVSSPPSSPQFYSRAPTTPHFDNTPNQFWIHETKTPAPTTTTTTTTTPNKTDDVSWINNMDSEMNGWLASLAEDILYQEQIQYQQQQQQLVALQEQQRQLEQQRQQLEQWAVMRRQQQQQVQMQMQMQMQQQLLHVDGTSTEEEWKNWLALEDEAAGASTTTTNTTVHTQTTRHQFDLVNIRPFVATVFN